MTGKHLLRLFIAGRTPKAESCIIRLQEILQRELSGEYELEVIDVLERPDLAEKEKILATPTLIKKLPPPVRRLLGDLTLEEKVLIGLDLKNID